MIWRILSLITLLGLASAAVTMGLISLQQEEAQPTPVPTVTEEWRTQTDAAWRDDPESNRFGPKTAVVWVEDGDRFYHRLLCPCIEECRHGAPRDAARDLLERLPCPLCEPGE